MPTLTGRGLILPTAPNFSMLYKRTAELVLVKCAILLLFPIYSDYNSSRIDDTFFLRDIEFSPYFSNILKLNINRASTHLHASKNLLL